MLANGEEEWSCVCQSLHAPEILETLISEVETMRLIKSSTTIPVLGAYFTIFDAGNLVDAQFMLTQRLSGSPLCISELGQVKKEFDF